MIGRRIWYSLSEMYSHVLVSSVRPRYSLRYARSQIDLSFGVMFEWSFNDDGGEVELRGEASTWARFPLMNVCGGFASIYVRIFSAFRLGREVVFMKDIRLTMISSMSFLSRSICMCLVGFQPDTILLSAIKTLMFL